MVDYGDGFVLVYQVVGYGYGLFWFVGVVGFDQFDFFVVDFICCVDVFCCLGCVVLVLFVEGGVGVGMWFGYVDYDVGQCMCGKIYYG